MRCKECRLMFDLVMYFALTLGALVCSHVLSFEVVAPEIRCYHHQREAYVLKCIFFDVALLP